MVSAFATGLLQTKWMNTNKFCTYQVLQNKSTKSPNKVDGFDWLNAQIIYEPQDGIHPKDEYSACYFKGSKQCSLHLTKCAVHATWVVGVPDCVGLICYPICNCMIADGHS